MRLFAEVNKREVDNSPICLLFLSLRTKKFNSIVVLGPTASGKTRIACFIASRLNGEVISVDSRQVYKHLDIGTGKDLLEYVVNGQPVAHHLINVNEVQDQFYLHDFVREAETAFNRICANQHLPVFCGGTGLYLDALRKNFSFTNVPEHPTLRADLEKREKADLLIRLAEYPTQFTKSVDRQSKKRIIRGIEIADYFMKQGPVTNISSPPYRPLYIGLVLERNKLKERIATRLDARLKLGLVDEVNGLLLKGVPIERLERLGLEYKFVSLFLKGTLSTAQMHDQLLTAIYQFSKRQMTWFRKMEKEGVEINWIDPDTDLEALVEQVTHLISE